MEAGKLKLDGKPDRLLKKLLIPFFLFVAANCLKADAGTEELSILLRDESGDLYLCSELQGLHSDNCAQRPNPILQLLRHKQKKNKRLTAAILAFPFPFGIVGLHRIYLGTAPYVPVVYIASVGGAFGILPLIDFFAIILEKDLDRFNNNNKVFMWVK